MHENTRHKFIHFPPLFHRGSRGLGSSNIRLDQTHSWSEEPPTHLCSQGDMLGTSGRTGSGGFPISVFKYNYHAQDERQMDG